VNKVVVSVREGMGGGQLSLMGWLNHKPVVFMAMAGDSSGGVILAVVHVGRAWAGTGFVSALLFSV